MLIFHILLPMTGDFLYSYLAVAQTDCRLFLPFQLQEVGQTVMRCFVLSHKITSICREDFLQPKSDRILYKHWYVLYV